MAQQHPELVSSQEIPQGVNLAQTEARLLVAEKGRATLAVEGQLVDLADKIQTVELPADVADPKEKESRYFLTTDAENGESVTQELTPSLATGLMRLKAQVEKRHQGTEEDVTPAVAASATPEPGSPLGRALPRRTPGKAEPISGSLLPGPDEVPLAPLSRRTPAMSNPIADAQIQGVAPSENKQKTASRSRSTGQLELSDLLGVEPNGKGEYIAPDGRRYTDTEISAVKAHEVQIRRGLAGLLASRGIVELDEKNRVHRDNGAFMSNKELVAIADRNPYGKPNNPFAKRTADMDSDTRAAYFANARATATETQPEKAGYTRKTRKLLLALGAAALFVTTLAGINSDNDHGTHQATRTSQTPDNQTPTKHAPKHRAEYKVEQGSVIAPKPVEQVRLHSGDTIWGLEEARHPQMSEAQIYGQVMRDLHANHMNWEDARHLDVGQIVKLVR